MQSGMNRFNIEPISIPTPVSPTTGIPLLAASDASTLPLSGVGAALETEAVSSSTEAKALARQRDFERLSAALANSEIRHEDLQVLANIGHGSAGVVQKVRHKPNFGFSMGGTHRGCHCHIMRRGWALDSS